MTDDGPAPVSALTRHIRSSRTSVRSAGELESVKNFLSLSAPTSMSSVHQLDDWPSWSDWMMQPGMLKKLTQIEDEMDECLMTVDADDVASSLRRTHSENVRGTSTGRLNSGDDGCRSTVTTSKSDQTLSWRRGWTHTQSVGDATTKDGGVISGVEMTEDDDAANGGVFVEVFPTTTSPAVITSVGSGDTNGPSGCQADTSGVGTAESGGPSSSGNYVGVGLARSSSDVTSQRRFHRRRSAVRYMNGLAPESGLTVHLFTPRHGHSCSFISDTSHATPDSLKDPPQPEVEEQQPVMDELDSSTYLSDSHQMETVEAEMTGCASEPVDAPAGPDPTADSTLKSTKSSLSLDVAVTVEVCDIDAEHTQYRSRCMNIPPVTISSHTSTPDEEPLDRKCVITMTSSPLGDRSSQLSSSVFTSPATQSHLNYISSTESNPNLLSVSRTGTFSSGGSTRNGSQRRTSHHIVAEAQDIISVDNGQRSSIAAGPVLRRQTTVTYSRRRATSRGYCCFLPTVRRRRRDVGRLTKN